MARPKKQPDFDISWENSNRQYQVHQLLSRSASFQNDAKHIRQKYGLSERGFELTETEKKDFIEDVKKILAKVKMPGDYAGIVTSLILGDKPEYIGWMKELPKQPRNKQFRVKRQLMKNLMIYHLVRERKMSYKQVADYINGFHDFIDDKGKTHTDYVNVSDFGTAEDMNYSDVSKHLEKLEKQIDEIYS